MSVWMGTVGEQPLLDPSRDVWLGSSLDSGWDTQESSLSHACVVQAVLIVLLEVKPLVQSDISLFCFVYLSF